MTPTLFGRWQVRLLFIFTVGLIISLPFFFGIIGPGGNAFLLILVYVAIFGCGWDILYHQLQQFRWDADWPGALQLLAAIWEAIFIIAVAKSIGLPGINKLAFPVPWFIIHYAIVWISIYLSANSLLRILFPHARFRGGQWF